LAKPWNRRRALDIFRDETDLSISPELLETIFEVLDQSSHFLLLASPRAASVYFTQMVKHHNAQLTDVAREIESKLHKEGFQAAVVRMRNLAAAVATA